MLYGYKSRGRAASGGLPFFLTIEAIFFNLYPFTFILSPKNAIFMA